MRQKAVVVAVVDHLDDDGFRDPVGLHVFQQGLRRGVARGDIGPLRERKFGVVFPGVDVGIDNAIVGGRERGHGERGPDKGAARDVRHKSAPGR